MKAILRNVLSQDSSVKEGTLAFIDDILVNEDVVTMSWVERHLTRYGLRSKFPERVADGAELLALRVWIKKGSLPSRLTSGEGICQNLLKLSTWWQVFEIWHGGRYDLGDFKNHRIQHETTPWRPICAQYNMEAMNKEKRHITVTVYSKFMCNTYFQHQWWQMCFWCFKV